MDKEYRAKGAKGQEESLEKARGRALSALERRHLCRHGFYDDMEPIHAGGEWKRSIARRDKKNRAKNELGARQLRVSSRRVFRFASWASYRASFQIPGCLHSKISQHTMPT